MREYNAQGSSGEGSGIEGAVIMNNADEINLKQLYNAQTAIGRLWFTDLPKGTPTPDYLPVMLALARKLQAEVKCYEGKRVVLACDGNSNAYHVMPESWVREADVNRVYYPDYYDGVLGVLTA